jgi:drug/metabolite transporter (DMT)-like permease
MAVSLRVWFAFALLSLTWGSSYLFIRVGVEQLSPLALVALRLVIGWVGLALMVAVLRQNVRLSRRHLLAAALLATINTTIPFLLITWGEETVPSGLTSVLNSTTPIFSVLIAAAILGDEPLTLPRLGGVVVGFGGVLLLLSRDLSHGVIHWSGVLSQGSIVLAALCYALGAVLARKTLRGVPAMTISFHVVTVAAAQALVLSLAFSPPPVGSLRASSILAVVWLGLLGSAFAYLLYYFVLEHWGAARTTLVTYVIPVVGITLGAIFLGEALDWRILAGSVLVIAGVVLASLAARPTIRRGEQEAPAPARRTSTGR